MLRKEFDAIEHKNEQVNIVFGSSIIAIFESDATTPGGGGGIHAYRGSITKEKLKFWKKITKENIDSTKWHKQYSQKRHERRRDLPGG